MPRTETPPIPEAFLLAQRAARNRELAHRGDIVVTQCENLITQVMRNSTKLDPVFVSALASLQSETEKFRKIQGGS